LNRIDELIVFHSLEREHIREITTLMAGQLRKRLQEQEIDFVLSEDAKDYLAKEGFDPVFGSRPLRRAIQKHIEDRLSEELLVGNITKGDTVVIGFKDGDLTVSKDNQAPVTSPSEE